MLQLEDLEAQWGLAGKLAIFASVVGGVYWIICFCRQVQEGECAVMSGGSLLLMYVGVWRRTYEGVSWGRNGRIRWEEEELGGYLDYKLSVLTGECRGNTRLDSQRER